MTVMRSKHTKSFKHKKTVITILVIIAVVISIIAGYFIILKIGENNLRKQLSDGYKKAVDGNYQEYEDADAFYNGSSYYYNKNLINILLIGVDKNVANSSGTKQADALYLLSLDTVDKSLNVIGISRNTLTEIDIYDMNGNCFATDNRQICLSYAYGNDDEQSSNLTVKAASKLLYGIPINGYYTIFMNSFESIINAVGGVPVRINEDLTDISPKMKKGAEITVTGKDALRYVQYRKDQNEQRFVRQKEFIASFVSQAKKAVLKDLSLPLKMYNKLSKNSVTDIDSSSAVYLASKAVEAEVQFHNIQGAVGFDGTYETFEVDDDKLYELVLDVFYKKQ